MFNKKEAKQTLQTIVIYFSWNSKAENPAGKVRCSRIGELIH